MFDHIFMYAYYIGVFTNFAAEEYKMMIGRREMARKEFQEKITEMSHVSLLN